MAEDAMSDDQFNTSSAKDVRAQTRDVRNIEEQFASDLDVVLSSTPGKRLLWYLLEGSDQDGSGVFNDPFVAGENDTTAYRCGLQARNKMLMTYLMEPKRFHLYVDMVEEFSTK